MCRLGALEVNDLEFPIRRCVLSLLTLEKGWSVLFLKGKGGKSRKEARERINLLFHCQSGLSTVRICTTEVQFKWSQLSTSIFNDLDLFWIFTGNNILLLAKDSIDLFEPRYVRYRLDCTPFSLQSIAEKPDPSTIFSTIFSFFHSISPEQISLNFMRI